MMFRKTKHLYFLAKIDTTVFNFGQNLIISINYNIYEEKECNI